LKDVNNAWVLFEFTKFDETNRDDKAVDENICVFTLTMKLSEDGGSKFV